ncbi:MAG: hypothetical protein WAL92_05040 [Thiogranum sp.]|jgi:hypothetical protein
MSRLTINDLTVSVELDPTAMTKVSGGLNFESKDTMIGDFSIGKTGVEPQAVHMSLMVASFKNGGGNYDNG